MTLPSVRPAPAEPNQHGYISSYVSPHGHLLGLRERLRRTLDRLGTDRSLPWVGLGLVNDLEVTLQLLNLQEFGEWLRVHGTPEQQLFADEIISNEFTLEAANDAAAHVRNLPSEPHALDPVTTIEKLDDAVDEARADYIAVRNVLVETGALDRDDEETPVADLLRALLS